jgi:uncharacterized protein YerC
MKRIRSELGIASIANIAAVKRARAVRHGYPTYQAVLLCHDNGHV